MKPPSLPATPWTEHYETLRRHALASRDHLGADPLGWGLVCRRGLAGWMNAWRQASEAPIASSPVPPRCPMTPGWQHELTVLLAQMTAPHLSAVSS